MEITHKNSDTCIGFRLPITGGYQDLTMYYDILFAVVDKYNNKVQYSYKNPNPSNNLLPVIEKSNSLLHVWLTAQNKAALQVGELRFWAKIVQNNGDLESGKAATVFDDVIYDLKNDPF